MTTRTGLVLLATTLLVGCGSSPPVHYYTLEPRDSSYVSDAEGSPVLGLGPIRVPEYLDRNQMVVRGANAELVVNDFDRWAEPLDDALHRTLATNVDGLIKNGIVVSFPYNALMQYDYRLVGRIDRFDAGLNGESVLAVHWVIAEKEGELVIEPRRSRYTARVSDIDDPGSIAKAMSHCLWQFSEDIAAQFEKLVR